MNMIKIKERWLRLKMKINDKFIKRIRIRHNWKCKYTVIIITYKYDEDILTKRYNIMGLFSKKEALATICIYYSLYLRRCNIEDK